MEPESLGGLPTLQVRVSLLSILFLLVAWTVFTNNVFNYYDDTSLGWPAPLFVVTLFAIFMALTSLLMFFAVYKGKSRSSITAMVLVILITIFWFCLSLISFKNNPTHLKLICNHLKCPESFWLVDLSYRNWRDDVSECKLSDLKPSHDLPLTRKDTSPSSPKPLTSIAIPSSPTTTTTVSPETASSAAPTTTTSKPTDAYDDNDVDSEGRTGAKRRRMVAEEVVRELKTPANGINNPFLRDFPPTLIESHILPNKADELKNDLRTFTKASQEELANNVFKVKFAVAIILFLINLLFLILSAITLWSYSQELLWLDQGGNTKLATKNISV